MKPDELDRLVAGNVRAERARIDIRQEDLADELGWTRPMVTKLEAGARRVSLADAIALCGALKIGLHQLLAGVDPETMKQIGIDRRAE